MGFPIRLVTMVLSLLLFNSLITFFFVCRSSMMMLKIQFLRQHLMLPYLRQALGRRFALTIFKSGFVSVYVIFD